MLVQFIGAALIPLAVVGTLSYLELSRALQRARDADLNHVEGVYRAAVGERLSAVVAAVQSAADADRPGLGPVERLRAHLGHEIDAIARYDAGLPAAAAVARGADGRLAELSTATIGMPAIADDAAGRLARGEPWIGMTTGISPRLVILRRYERGASTPEVWGAVVSNAYLAAAGQALRATAELCLVGPGGVPLGCPSALDGSALLRLSVGDGGRARREVRWSRDDTPLRAIAAPLAAGESLPAAFDGSRWAVVAVQSGAADVDPMGAYRPLFAAIGVFSVLGTLAIGLVQVRRIVGPVHQLLDGTRRIAQQDFAVQVRHDGRDELAQLATAFNEMARGLGMNFATMNVLTEIDRTILSKLEIGEVMRSAVRCVRYVADVDVVVLAIFDAESPGSIRIYSLPRGGRDRVSRTQLRIDAAMRDAIVAAKPQGWVDAPPLPDAFVERLRVEESVYAYYTQPIARGDRTWGLMVLGHFSAMPLTPEQGKLLVGVADRLEVAFSAFERDRRLHTMAHVDALTGLPNRHSILQLLSQELAHAGRKRAKVAVLFVDLDRFKQANDTLGHAVGDRLLRYAAERIRNHIRGDDVVARIGGDEFTVVLGNLAAARDAGPVAQALIDALTRPFEIDGQRVYIGASVGVAVYPDDGADSGDLLKKADVAMYRAKDQGRGRCVYFEERMNVEAHRRAVLDRELRQALERGEFVLHYQPQVELATGRVVAVEALVRWQHPEQGLLYPGAFIPLAEESGLIDEIGAWVMRDACLQHQRWREEGVPIPRIAVNVSNGQLRSANFVEKLHQLFESTCSPPGAIEIEVTESLFLEGDRITLDSLRTLAAEGTPVAIDDFGTGYSSFGYLKTLPATILKLDKSFIADVATDPDAATIVAAMVNMAHTLRKEVVAEGVEREEQLEFLRGLACEKVQGFYFSRPLPPADVAAYARLRAAGDDGTEPAATVQAIEAESADPAIEPEGTDQAIETA